MTFVIDCKQISRQMSIKTLEIASEYFSKIFYECKKHAPCCIILDSLDTITPNQQTESQDQAQSQIKTSFFTNLFKNQILNSDAEIRLIGVTRSSDKLSNSLRDFGIFDNNIPMHPPSFDLRLILLKHLFKQQIQLIQQELGKGTVDSLINSTQHFLVQDFLSLHSKFIQLHSQNKQYAPQQLFQLLELAIKSHVIISMSNMNVVKPDIDFTDIGGMYAAKQAINDAFNLPNKFKRLFRQLKIRPSSGLLLYGPPGCGKTMIASSIAKQCGVNFFSVKGPQILSKYIGQSEQNVRQAFEKAAQAKPSVLFFDQFESIVPKRGSGSTGVTDRIVNQFLCYLDGVQGRDGVYVVGASSRPDSIDIALLRPGRLDKQVYCGFPSKQERFQIIKLYIKGLKIRGANDDDDDDDEGQEMVERFCLEIAQKTQGFTGADLKGLIYNAQLNSVHRALKQAQISGEEIKQAPPTDLSDIQLSLKNYKPSLGQNERHRLEYIYTKFSSGGQVTDVSKQKTTLH